MKKTAYSFPGNVQKNMQVFQKYHLPCYVVGYCDTEWVQLVIVWGRKRPRLIFLSVCMRLKWKLRAAVHLFGLFACQRAFAMTAFLGKAKPLRRGKKVPSTEWKADCNIKPQLSEAILCLIRSECGESINCHWHVLLICFRSTGGWGWGGVLSPPAQRSSIQHGHPLWVMYLKLDISSPLAGVIFASASITFILNAMGPEHNTKRLQWFIRIFLGSWHCKSDASFPIGMASASSSQVWWPASSINLNIDLHFHFLHLSLTSVVCKSSVLLWVKGMSCRAMIFYCPSKQPYTCLLSTSAQCPQCS